MEKAKINLISFDSEVIKSALYGPTQDLEDNVQLHSAVTSSCNFFLTNDKNLLKMRFFGKMKIVNSL